MCCYHYVHIFHDVCVVRICAPQTPMLTLFVGARTRGSVQQQHNMVHQQYARLCDQTSKAAQGAHQESTFALACEDQLEADL